MLHSVARFVLCPIYIEYYGSDKGIQEKCNTLKEVVFNGQCYSIPENICKSSTISSLTIGNCVREIGSHAFQDCNSLEQIRVNNIDAFASIKFDDTPQKGRCLSNEYGEALTNLTLHAASISAHAFSGVVGIESIILDDNVISVESEAFNGIKSLKNVKIMGDEITWGSGVFGQNSQLEEIEIDQLNSVGDRMFENCPAIKTVSFPNVKKIGEYAFYGCTNLEEIDAPVLSSLGAYSFANTKLSTIKLPLIKEIGDKAFENCNNLLNADFGVKINSLGENIFNECKSLTTLTIKSFNPPYSNKSFTNYIYVNTTLCVPEICVDEYKSTTPWSNFFDITGLQLNYIELDDCMYYNCSVNFEADQSRLSR